VVRTGRRAPAGLCDRRRGRGCARKGDEQRVAFGAELEASLRRHDLAQDAVVIGETAGPAIAEPLSERRPSMSVKSSVTVPDGSSTSARA
jgi:hypothetical protein